MATISEKNQDHSSSTLAGNGHPAAENGNAALARFITPGGHPIDNSQPAFPIYHRKIANPAPLGLCGFAVTTFILSMYNLSVRDITVPNVVVGCALGYGGLVQLLAGMWEFAAGNTFGATAFSSYGAFWISYASLYIPGLGIRKAYAEDAAMFANAVGVYLIAWEIFCLIMLMSCLRSSVALVTVFVLISITFPLLIAGEFTHNQACVKAGGVFGLLTAFAAWWVAFAGLMDAPSTAFKVPVFELSPKKGE